MSQNTDIKSIIEEGVWEQRYRPQYMADCVFPTNIQKLADGIIAADRKQDGKGIMSNYLLSGSSGTGKSTLAGVLINELEYDVLKINGSIEGRLMETLRNKITVFASSVSFSGNRKCVYIDEGDAMPQAVQEGLRSFIEEYSNNCSFIITCNFPNRITSHLHSRFNHIEFGSFSGPEEVAEMSKAMFLRCEKILKNEGIEYERAAVAAIVKQRFPDFRKTVQDLQKYSAMGKIDSGILSRGITTNYDDLIGILRNKDFNKMRAWVGESTHAEIASVSRALYKSAKEVMKPESMPQLVLDLADYSYKDSFVADKEINLAAMLTTIMMNCEFLPE